MKRFVEALATALVSTAVACFFVLMLLLLMGCEPTKEQENAKLVTKADDIELLTTPKPQVLVEAVVHSGKKDMTPIPQVAYTYQRQLIGAARQVWGLDAPIPAFAAQIHQESGWNANAKSPAGALGIAQFMPATANWIDGVYPEELGEAQPMNPAWGIRALVRYNKHLYDRINAVDDCNKMAFTLSAYNGGLGWVQRDQAIAKGKGLNSGIYWDTVEKFNAGRNAAAFKENRGYPVRIIQTLQPRYTLWGKLTCSGTSQ